MPLASRDITGVWATVLLDIAERGTINFDAIADQVAAYADAGVNGIYCGGTAAEFHALGDADHQRVNEKTAVACRKHHLPFQLGAAHPLPQQALERVRRATELEPGAIQVTLPDWVSLEVAEARGFLEACRRVADPIGLVLYNPPHAKKVLAPSELLELVTANTGLVGIKCGGGDERWYADMEPVFNQVSVFIPGHQFASGIARGAHGSYSNMACLSPGGSVRWAETTRNDPWAALGLEQRILAFMRDALTPLLEAGHPGYACDKLMAAAGGWTQISPRLLWPHKSVAEAEIDRVRAAARNHIPEFME